MNQQNWQQGRCRGAALLPVLFETDVVRVSHQLSDGLAATSIRSCNGTVLDRRYRLGLLLYRQNDDRRVGQNVIRRQLIRATHRTAQTTALRAVFALT